MFIGKTLFEYEQIGHYLRGLSNKFKNLSVTYYVKYSNLQNLNESDLYLLLYSQSFTQKENKKKSKTYSEIIDNFEESYSKKLMECLQNSTNILENLLKKKTFFKVSNLKNTV